MAINSIDELKEVLAKHETLADVIEVPKVATDGLTLDELVSVLGISRGRILKVVTFITRDAGGVTGAVDGGAGKTCDSVRDPEHASEHTPKHDSAPVFAVVRATDRVREAALEEFLGKKIRLAKASEVREITGCKIGTVSPIGVLNVVTVFDTASGIMDEDEVLVPAGIPNQKTQVKIRFGDLVRLVSSTSKKTHVLRISEPPKR